jgi:hypothetical protein
VNGEDEGRRCEFIRIPTGTEAGLPPASQQGQTVAMYVVLTMVDSLLGAGFRFGLVWFGLVHLP